MRRIHTLWRGLRAVCRVLLRHRSAAGPASEPADLGTAFGLDAAIEAQAGGATPLAR